MAADVTTVLADLDDTLFDHAHATRHALDGVRALEPRWADWSADEFHARHSETLETLHHDVLAGRLGVEAARVERFRRLLQAASPDEAIAERRAVDVAAQYRVAYESGWRAVPGAPELLGALARLGVRVVVVTNNLVAEQRLKIERCGLAPFVSALVTSEEVGAVKPDPEIFRAALDRAGAGKDAAVMLGDAWRTDIEGARAFGIRAVWLNRLAAVSPDPDVAELRSLEPTGDVLRALMPQRPS